MDSKYSKFHSKGQFSKDRPRVMCCHLSYIGKLSEFSGICRFYAVFINRINTILMFFHCTLKNTYTKIIFFPITSYSWAQIEYNHEIYFLLEKKIRKSKGETGINHKSLSFEVHKMSGIKENPKYFIFQFMWALILSIIQLTKQVITWGR